MTNEQPNKEMTAEQAKRLLRAIFYDAEGDLEEADDNYPDTVTEKVGYAEYALAADLGYIGKAIQRLSRLSRLLAVTENDENGLPPIILHNEVRMALEPLLRVKDDIAEIAGWLMPIYRETKPQAGEVQG